MSLKVKIAIIFAIITVVQLTATIGYSVFTIKSRVIQAAQKKLVTDLQLGRVLLDQMYPGEWQAVNGQLFKGNRSMNGDEALVDLIGDATGDTVTIFQGDTRVATNVKGADGARAVGTKVSEAVAKTVLTDGQVYIGRANVAGNINQTAYEPIKDGSGKIIGIWYVGVPDKPYEDIAAGLRRELLLIGMGSLVVVCVSAWAIGTALTRPLGVLEQAARHVADGDLSVAWSIKNRDEVGSLSSSLSTMLSSLKGLVKKVQASAQQLASSSEELNRTTEQTSESIAEVSQAAQQLAVAAQKQEAGVTAETASIQAAARNVGEIERMSSQAADIADASLASAAEGIDSVVATSTQIRSASDSAAAVADLMADLGRKLEAISDFVRNISGISRQTSILALNASIEAARAGEHGKGFSVVAAEVGKLAGETQAAAREINNVVAGVQASVLSVLEGTEASVIAVNGAVEMAALSQSAFTRIQAAVADVTAQIRRIAETAVALNSETGAMLTAAGEINNIARQVSAASQTSAAATEQQSAQMEEVAALAGSLAVVADQLHSEAAKFTV